MSPPAIPPPVDVLPPVDPRTALRVMAVGAGLCGVAALLDFVPLTESGGPAGLSTIRLLLVAVGALTAGGALSWRPDLWGLWLAAAGAAVLASVGIPEAQPGDWDSARLLARVMAAGGAAGALLTAISPRARYALLSAFALFHFGGILTAVTWPPTGGTPPPWVTTQAAGRLYVPYFKFLYLSNAYHFYSPEPGPASKLFFLLTYELTKTTPPSADEKPASWKQSADPETGKPRWAKTASEWVDLPNRRQHYKDPLGLSYYRRLSVTEMVSQAMPSRYTPRTFEKSVAFRRRERVAMGTHDASPAVGAKNLPAIPLDPQAGPEDLQYRVPNADIVRYLLPSYTRHVADEFSHPERGAIPARRVVSVKVFRVEHSITQPEAFHGRRIPYNSRKKWADPVDPFHPTTYRPYYQGEYDAEGRLADPTDPMLYWLCPISPKTPSAADPKGRDYEDYMSKYAGFEFDWERRTGQ